MSIPYSKSDGKVPAVFLRVAGVPENFITFVPSVAGRAIEVLLVLSRRRSENVCVRFAPEDMKGGRKLHEEIFRAIQIHDKPLLVLSESSMKSEGAITEIRRASNSLKLCGMDSTLPHLKDSRERILDA